MTPAPTGVDGEDAARHAADGAARRAEPRELLDEPGLVRHVLAALQGPHQVEGAVGEGRARRVLGLQGDVQAPRELVAPRRLLRRQRQAHDVRAVLPRDVPRLSLIHI